MEENEASTVRYLEENKKLISKLIEEQNGRVVDAPGDNLLAEFSSITNAVECAVKIQWELKKKNANIVENRRMEFRIGINLGEVVEEGGRIYGSGVNIAARIEGLSTSGGICISGRTYDHVKTIFDFGYEYLGEHSVKNISEPIRVYRMLMDPYKAGKAIGEKISSGKPSRSKILGAVIVCVLILAVFLFWRFYPGQSLITGQDSVAPNKRPVASEIKEAPKTIAVLPFENLSSDPEQGYFVDGLSEEILNSLTQIPSLGVTARTSSFAFKGTGKTVQEIASVLGVDHVLEGSVRKAGNTLRITAQLIRASDGLHLWSETYDRKLDDIFKIQEDIANNVADKLKLTLEAFNILGGTENIKAYELYLVAKGKAAVNASEWQNKLELFDKALALDTNFALAHTEKAYAHVQLALNSPPNRVAGQLEAALIEAAKAIELEPKSGLPYVIICHIYMGRGHWIEAENNCRKAIGLLNGKLCSGDESWIPGFYMAGGHFKRGHELLSQIQKKDPLNNGNHGWFILSLALLGDMQEVENEYEDYMNENTNDAWVDACISVFRLCTGDVLNRDQIVFSDNIFDLGKEYIDSPEKGLIKLRELYTENDNLDAKSLQEISIWAAYFGDSEFAMEALEKTVNMDLNIATYAWFPIFKEVRKMPRFKKYVREIGLVDYWKEYGWPDSNICHPVGDDDFVCE